MQIALPSCEEQFVVCVRFVYKKPDDDNRIKHSVRGEFLYFVHADTDTKADNLETKAWTGLRWSNRHE